MLLVAGCWVGDALTPTPNVDPTPFVPTLHSLSYNVTERPACVSWTMGAVRCGRSNSHTKVSQIGKYKILTVFA